MIKDECLTLCFFLPPFSQSLHPSISSSLISSGTSVIQVTATDADDATYGNSAKVVYSILEGQPYFSVDPDTGEWLLLAEGAGPPG